MLISIYLAHAILAHHDCMWGICLENLAFPHPRQGQSVRCSFMLLSYLTALLGRQSRTFFCIALFNTLMLPWYWTPRPRLLASSGLSQFTLPPSPILARGSLMHLEEKRSCTLQLTMQTAHQGHCRPHSYFSCHLKTWWALLLILGCKRVSLYGIRPFYLDRDAELCKHCMSKVTGGTEVHTRAKICKQTNRDLQFGWAANLGGQHLAHGMPPHRRQPFPPAMHTSLSDITLWAVLYLEYLTAHTG